jgi:hypothetical protein
MFDIVNRRSFRKIAHLLVAAQVLLSAPMGTALAAMAGAADSAACEGMMHATDGSDPCPCCPEGDTNTAACLSACAASAGMVETIAAIQANSTIVLAAPRALGSLVSLADPPVTPPPIV